MLSRLEAREILRCLSSHDECDEEVVDKLYQLAGWVNPAQSAPRQLPTMQEVRPRFESVVAGRIVPDSWGQQATGANSREAWEARMPRAAYGHLTTKDANGNVIFDEAAYQALIDQRMSGERLDSVKREQISMEAMNPARVPPQHKVVKEAVEVGGKNSLGDICIGFRDDLPIFQCKYGHGYFANNPAIRGCGECALAGNAQGNAEEATVTTKRVDPGAIAGEESNW